MIRLVAGLLAAVLLLPQANASAKLRGRVDIKTPRQTLQLVERSDGNLVFIGQNGSETAPFPKRRLSYYSSFFFQDAAIHTLASGMTAGAAAASWVWLAKVVYPEASKIYKEGGHFIGYLLGGLGFLLPAITTGVALWQAETITLPSYRVASVPSKLLQALDQAATGKFVYLETRADIVINSEGRIVPAFDRVSTNSPIVSRAL